MAAGRQLKPLPPAEGQERRRLEDLLATVGSAGRFPQTPQNCATFRAVCVASLKTSKSFSFRLSNVDFPLLPFIVLPRTLAFFRLFR